MKVSWFMRSRRGKGCSRFLVGLLFACSLLRVSAAWSQGSLLDDEKLPPSVTISADAQQHWQNALALATRTGPNSAIFHNSSVPELRAAAEAGHPYAEYWLSQLYLAHALVSGYTVMGLAAADDQNAAWSQTDAEGVRWLMKAAEQGLPLAEWNLYVAYNNGQGVPKDPVRAEEWLRQAAEHGLAKAQYKYGGTLYNDGDVEKGSVLIRDAAKQHYFAAVVDMFKAGSYKYAYEMDRSALEKAASSGNVVAMRVLGNELKPDGKFPTDLGKALDYEMQAAEHGDVVAEYNVGIEFWKPENRIEDDAQGFKWLLKAAEAGYPDAQSAVGISYDLGYGVPVDLSKAGEWYSRAVAQGDYQAAYNLGLMYEQGRGVTRDLVRATKLYDVGARQGQPEPIKNYMRMFGEGHVMYRGGTLVAIGR